MSFRLFRVPVQVQISFWITCVLFGLYDAQNTDLPKGPVVVIWAIAVFVSILAHEMGHALAMMRHGIAPEVMLYSMGGLTFNRSSIPLRRRDQVVISLAGPFAGFLLGGLVLGARHEWPAFFASLPPLAQYAVGTMEWVNIGWGLFNLVPVLPLDGGRVLEETLGPKRAQLSAGISTLIGALVGAVFLFQQQIFIALMFGYGAYYSYRRFEAAGSDDSSERRWSFRPKAPADTKAPDVLPPELETLLRMAEHALGEEDLGRAVALAQQVLAAEEGGSPPARRRALSVIAWTHLLSGRPEVAAGLLEEIRRAAPASRLGLGRAPAAVDPALEGAVLFALRDLAKAREVLEAARAQGDDRKQVIGPLVQILLEQGEVGRAAEVALSVIDVLSDEDARKMAELAFSHGAFGPAAQLSEAIFERRREPEDAYEAARAEARAGRPDWAVELLRQAVEAGFSDRARAWSDAALATLRAGGDVGPSVLETVLPRP